MLRVFLATIFGKRESVRGQEYEVIFHYRYGFGETFATETELAKMKRRWPELTVVGKTPVYSAPPDATLEDLLRIQNEYTSPNSA